LRIIKIIILVSFFMAGTTAVHAGQKPAAEEAQTVSEEEPSGGVTLRRALAYALLKSPELTAFGPEKRAGDALALQAGFYPNPKFSVDVEDFSGSGPYTGTDLTQTTIMLSQKLEMAGKRPKRRRVASMQRNLVDWRYEVKKQDVALKVTKAFVDVLASQQRLKLKKDSAELAKQIKDVVALRVQAGKVSPVEEIKAGVFLSIAKIELRRAEQELFAARKKLAALWGSGSPRFEQAEGSLTELFPLPEESALEKRISDNPEIGRFGAEMEYRRARVELEKARRTPDLTVSGGVRRFNETNDNAIEFGLSIPIPVLNRNQGKVAAAGYDLMKLRDERRAAKLRIKSSLADGYTALSGAFFEARALRGDVLPAAKKAFDAEREGYLQGKFGFLDVLDAQRTLFEVRNRNILVLADYHKSIADVERLVGGAIVRRNEGRNSR